ncbi:hypothetical protein ACLOJK_026146 [Asimina triloba]
MCFFASEFNQGAIVWPQVLPWFAKEVFQLPTANGSVMTPACASSLVNSIRGPLCGLKFFLLSCIRSKAFQKRIFTELLVSMRMRQTTQPAMVAEKMTIASSRGIKSMKSLPGRNLAMNAILMTLGTRPSIWASNEEMETDGSLRNQARAFPSRSGRLGSLSSPPARAAQRACHNPIIPRDISVRLRERLPSPETETSAPQHGEFLFFALLVSSRYNLDDDGAHFDPCLNPHCLARGLKKHLKRLNAPKHWMLDKLGGAFAPKPSSGPHKARECLPLILILRNKLKYALTYREVISILMQRHVMVDGKTRTDKTYPAGFMDVVSIHKTNENFRLLYDTKGRFRLRTIKDEEAKFKLCKVRSVQFGLKGIPYVNTYDGRTIRYPDPLIRANDTIKIDLETNKIVDFIKFDVGNVIMVTGGRNRGRVGVIKNREKHKGSFETIHVQDATGHEFATRLGNVFTIGKGTKPWVSLPKGKGIKLSIIEEARKRIAAAAAAASAAAS